VNLLTLVFPMIVAQSCRIGCLILVLGVVRMAVRSRIPARLLFAGWIVVAVALLVPVSLPARWSPFNLVHLERLVSHAGLAGGRRDGPAAGPISSAQPYSISAGTRIPSAEIRSSSVSEAARVLPIVWVAGFGALLGVQLLGWLRLQRLIREPAGRAGPEIEAAVAEIAQLLRIKRRILVHVTDSAGTAALGGFWRPHLFVPRRMAEGLAPDELRLVILHELGHWRRRDMVASRLIRGSLALHWFNPLVWLGARMAQTDCELACDEFVLRRMPADTLPEYGATLLKVLELACERDPSPSLLGIFGKRQQLTRRIHMIAQYGTRNALGMMAGCCFLALFAASAVTGETGDQNPNENTGLSKLFGAWTGWQKNVTMHGVNFEKAKVDQRGFVTGSVAADTTIGGRPCKQGWVHLHPNGVPASFTASADIPLGRFFIPSGTWVFQNEQGIITVCSFPRDVEIQGHVCRGGGIWGILGGSEGVQAAFYPSGALKHFFVRHPVRIDGVPCAASVFHGIELYENGRLKSATLSEDFEQDREIHHKGERLRLTSEGHVQPGPIQGGR